MPGDMTESSPIYLQAVPGANRRIAPVIQDDDERPIMHSEKKIGRARKTEDNIYMMMNAAPPYSPTIYGNLQRLPSPIADPAIASTAATLLPKFSLPFDILSLLIYREFEIETVLRVEFCLGAGHFLPYLQVYLREESISVNLRVDVGDIECVHIIYRRPIH